MPARHRKLNKELGASIDQQSVREGLIFKNNFVFETREQFYNSRQI